MGTGFRIRSCATSIVSALAGLARAVYLTNTSRIAPAYHPHRRRCPRRTLMSAPINLESLDLAALLCSRVCHDLISPVGAIVNGLEVLEEEKDEETKTFALDLIKKSARNASARLQFCRLAFGAAGSTSSQIDVGDAEPLARGFLEDEKTKLI